MRRYDKFEDGLIELRSVGEASRHHLNFEYAIEKFVSISLDTKSFYALKFLQVELYLYKAKERKRLN